MTDLDDADLEYTRDLGASTYLSAYVHLMSRKLGIDDSDNEAVNGMALQMLDTLNLSTVAAWCGLMNDKDGVENALKELRGTVEALYDDKG
jgi:hypothetical protein